LPSETLYAASPRWINPSRRRIPIYGYLYAVESGRPIEVPEATPIGQAR
jgi:hypothetical protein